VLAAATAMANPWAGLFVIWMLAGLIAASLGLLASREDFPVLLLFWAASLLIAALLQLSDHVVLPLLVLGAGCALVIGFQVIRDYQFRKRHAAGAP
jgi:cell division protein FtsW (lipid II flippase)